MNTDPHQGGELVQSGVPFRQAKAAMILVHGRGATAQSILALADELDAEGFAVLAPQARGNSWYPHSFLAPISANEPGISSGIQLLAELVGRIEEHGIEPAKTILLGFSQGACLALEYAARHAQRFGGLVGLSGGLIGPPNTPRDYPGSLAGTPVFLGCSDVDFHIPRERVEESEQVLTRMGGQVTMRLYPGMGHTVNQDELDVVRQMTRDLVGS
jgi:predicted esterase